MAIKKFNSEEGFSTGYNPIDVIDANGNVTANAFFATTSADLGDIANITITGGSNGQAITTDGFGNLSFTTISGGSGNVAGSNGAIQYNANGVLGADASLYFDPDVQVLYATLFSGDGSLLSNLAGPNVVGDVPNANYASFSNVATLATNANVANTVANASQPNITSVGTLISLSVSGDINSGNANLGNAATANYFIGNGTFLTYLDGAAVVGEVANANYASFANVTLSSNAANTVTASAQPNITEVGTLTQLIIAGNTEANLLTANSLVSNSSLLVKGDTSLLGNLIVYGNAIYADVQTLEVKDPIISMGGNPNGDPLTANDGYDRGTLLHYFTTLPVDAFMGWDNSNSEFIFGSNVSYISNTITVNEYGNVRADYFIGNGAQLTYLTGANVTGNVPNADFSTNANFAAFAGNVTASSQPNITSLGTLVNVSVTGNVNSGNANLGNLVFGNYFIGDGSNLANINAGNIVGTITNASIANAENASTANVALSVANSSQPNITSVGTLINLSVSGDIYSGNANLGDNVTANYFIGNAVYLTNIPAANIVGSIETSNFAAYAGNITESSQPNITSVGVLGSLSVSGNIKSGNANLGNAVLANFFVGSGANLSDIAAANIIGEVSNANYATYSDQANSATTATTATTAGTVTTADQPNITSVGTLTILSVTGNIRSGNANLGNTVTGNFFVGSGNNLSNIQGANVVGSVANASFSDYAEQSNTANAALIAGTVTTAAQPNITSVGTLTSLSVSGTATVGNINSAGNISIAGNITASNITGNFSGNIIGNVTAPGNTTEIIFNDAGNTAASNAFTFNNSTNVVALTGNISVTGNISRDNKNVPTYVAQSGAPSSPRIGDEWYDTDNDVTYQYVYDGATYQWVDVTTGYINANTSAVANTLVLRDANGSFYSNVLYANGGNFTEAVYSAATVTYPTQLATKSYVDQQSSTGIHIHTPVRVKTTGALTASYTAGGTALIVNTISSGTLFTTSTNHGLSLNDMIISSSTTNGLVSGTPYFVYATPALNTFELSATYGGDELTTFTDGTGLVINITANPGVGATLTNSGATVGLVIDTIPVANTDRVLVASQTNAFENGVYTVTDNGSISTNWILTRSTDADRYAPQETFGIGEGDYFFVTEGSLGAGDSFVLTTEGVIIIGTTNLTYTLFSAAITYIGTSPVKIEGQTISLANTTGTGDYVVLANSPQLNTPNIGAATGTSLSLTGNLTSGNAELGNLANASFLSGTLITASQPNISAVGTLTSLSVSGNVFAPAIVQNAGSYDTRISLSSAAGIIEITTNGNTTKFQPSGTIELGGASQITGGTFAGSGITLGGSQTDIFQNRGGNVTVQVGTGGSIAKTWTFAQDGSFTSPGNITGNYIIGNNISTAGNVDFTGPNFYISNIANFHIPGGTANYAIITDGSGNLTWGLAGTGNANVAGSNTQLQFNDEGNLGASANLTFDKSTNTFATYSINATGNVNFTGPNIYISNIANFRIPGGTANYAIITDGSGNLTWGLAGTGNANVAGSNTQIQFNDDGNLGASANLAFDKTSNTLSTTVLSTTGNANVGNVNTANLSASGNVSFSGADINLGSNANLHISGGSPGYVLSTDGSGNLSWSAGGSGSGNAISFGNSNVDIGSSGGNVTVTVAGNANIAKFTGTGLIIDGNLSASNANLGNLTTSNYFRGTFDANSNSQPNIKSLGTLTSLTIGPNSSLIMSGNTGYVRANSIQGRDGSQSIYMYYGDVSGSVGIVTDLTIGASGTGNLVVANGNVTFSGANVDLGTASNIHISGGSLNYVLTSDGAGNVSWSPPAGGGGVSGSNTQLQYNAAGAFAGTPGLTFDNTANRLTLQNYAVIRNQLGNVIGSRTINLNLGGYVSATSIGITSWAFTNPTASPNASGFVLELTNGGSFVQVWPTTVRWPSSIPPTLTTTGVDLLVFITDDGGLNWRGSLVMIDSR